MPTIHGPTIHGPTIHERTTHERTTHEPTTHDAPAPQEPLPTYPAHVDPAGAAATESADSVAPSARTPATGDGVLHVVHGAKRVAWAAYKIQRNASTLVRAVVKPPYAATDSLDSLERLKLSEGVTFQVLYDRTALAVAPQLDVTARLVALGEQARVVHLAPTKMLLVDNEVALLPLTTGPHSVDSAVVVRNSALLAAVSRVFDDLWRFAAPFTATAEQPPSGDRPTEEERWILSLLASGSTDDAIGRMMGFSARTAHRRVRELVGRLGVETRFQAGVQAVKLGWL